MSKRPKRCGNCKYYEPDEFEIGSGNCEEIQRREEPDDDPCAISVLVDECTCGGRYWEQGETSIIQCPVCGDGYVKEPIVTPDSISLTGKIDSWDNFFDVLFNLKAPIERLDGGSLSNFWAFVQTLQERFMEARKR
jgi:hypothetical protein